MSDSAVSTRTITVPRRCTCSPGMDVRLVAQDCQPDTKWALIVPGQTTVVANADDMIASFVCVCEEAKWPNMLENILVGLGFYHSTLSVLEAMVDAKAGNSQFTVTKSLDNMGTVLHVLKGE